MCSVVGVVLARTFNPVGGQGRVGGSRSKLFFEMPRIFKKLEKIFCCPVFKFVENVYSMTKENRDQFSTTLGYEPVLLDCTAFAK